MKYLKWLLLLPVAAFPYLFFVFYWLTHWEPFTRAELGWLVGLAAVVAVLLARGRWTGRELALANMLMKLIHIPAYVLWFGLGLAIFLFAGPILAFVMDALAIALSGLVGLAAVLRCRAEGRLTAGAAVVNGILQFVFCADVFSAFWVFYKSGKREESLS